jgi:hypothetical protein
MLPKKRMAFGNNRHAGAAKSLYTICCGGCHVTNKLGSQIFQATTASLSDLTAANP